MKIKKAETEIGKEKMSENPEEEETMHEKGDASTENAEPTTQNVKVNKAGGNWNSAKSFQSNIRDSEGPGGGGRPSNFRIKKQGYILH